MFFKIIQQAKKSKARRGLLTTSHGVIETPAFIPVATQAVVKSLTNAQLENIPIQAVLCNTYHLYLRPGDQLIKQMGGLHRFMNWSKPVFTDSGGFQIFSLGLGKQHGVGKIIKSQKTKKNSKSLVKITEEGAAFYSHLDGSKHFLTPEKSILIQRHLGADIIFAFDECTSPLSSKKYTKEALKRTHRWAQRSLTQFQKSAKSPAVSRPPLKQLLFGIVQGGEYKELRAESSRFIGALDFDGFGIGGSFGNKNEKQFRQILRQALLHLPLAKPRHLLGIGGLDDIRQAVAEGIDTFDCVEPTRLGRHGVALLNKGKINLKSKTALYNKKPIAKDCLCFTCQHHSCSYLSHLFRAGEMTAAALVTIHNLFFMEKLLKAIRESI